MSTSPFEGFPPPSLPSNTSGKVSAFSPAVVAIVAVLGAALLIVGYYRIFAKLCTRWQNRRDDFDAEGQLSRVAVDAHVSAPPPSNQGLDEALIKKIPIFVFKSGDGFAVETDCPVCLMEFVDNQELRMLPKCAHAFHVSCIDMWLNSHSTCPLCRARIWPEQVLNPPHSSPLRMYALDVQIHPESAGEFSGVLQRSPSSTLRGPLNYEDQHAIWIPDAYVAGGPGEESIRLSDPRNHGGDSSRHHSQVLPGVDGNVTTPQSSACGITEDSKCGTWFSSDTGPRRPGMRAASFKEPRSQPPDLEHKWHIPARRPSFRKNPFSIVRSYSMGTSRRLLHALEFLDLEEHRNGQNKGGAKIFSPQEYVIATPPEYPGLNSSSSPVEALTRDAQKSEEIAGE